VSRGKEYVRVVVLERGCHVQGRGGVLTYSFLNGVYVLEARRKVVVMRQSRKPTVSDKARCSKLVLLLWVGL
jgi:hypothetical protein